jgi:hypothetical protein
MNPLRKLVRLPRVIERDESFEVQDAVGMHSVFDPDHCLVGVCVETVFLSPADWRSAICK